MAQLVIDFLKVINVEEDDTEIKISFSLGFLTDLLKTGLVSGTILDVCKCIDV